MRSLLPLVQYKATGAWTSGNVAVPATRLLCDGKLDGLEAEVYALCEQHMLGSFSQTPIRLRYSV